MQVSLTTDLCADLYFIQTTHSDIRKWSYKNGEFTKRVRKSSLSKESYINKLIIKIIFNLVNNVENEYKIRQSTIYDDKKEIKFFLKASLPTLNLFHQELYSGILNLDANTISSAFKEYKYNFSCCSLKQQVLGHIISFIAKISEKILMTPFPGLIKRNAHNFRALLNNAELHYLFPESAAPICKFFSKTHAFSIEKKEYRHMHAVNIYNHFLTPGKLPFYIPEYYIKLIRNELMSQSIPKETLFDEVKTEITIFLLEKKWDEFKKSISTQINSRFFTPNELSILIENDLTKPFIEKKFTENQPKQIRCIFKLIRSIFKYEKLTHSLETHEQMQKILSLANKKGCATLFKKIDPPYTLKNIKKLALEKLHLYLMK